MAEGDCGMSGAAQRPPLSRSHEARSAAHRCVIFFRMSRALLSAAHPCMIRKKTKTKLGLLLCLSASQACLAEYTVLQTSDAGAAVQLGEAGPMPSGGAFQGGPNGSAVGDELTRVPAAKTCSLGGPCQYIDTRVVDRLDLLLVIDNSESMAEEQARLVEQLPNLMAALTNGKRSPDDSRPFPPAKDVHIGIVSTDMGLPAVSGVDHCDENGGDDARLQHTPRARDCDEAYPDFLSYVTAGDVSPEHYTRDMRCLASLGTNGCGFTQPLEAGLKALWPKTFLDAAGNEPSPNPIMFLATTPAGTFGRGSQQPGPNDYGFLRNFSYDGTALLAIVVITDKDDCSLRSTEAMRPQRQLDPSSPYYDQPLNLRCFYNKQQLYDAADRYVQAYRLLHPGNDDLVVFGAIAGVPTNLVDAVARARFDLATPAGRSEYYAQLLDDARMQETIDPIPAQAGQRLRPACMRGTDPTDVAYPARRLAEVARGMGANGVIQSICGDLGSAFEPIVDTIGSRLGARCLPFELQRSAKGTVDCDLIWELPPPGKYTQYVTTECGQWDILKPVKSPRRAKNDRGGNNCVQDQAPVFDGQPIRSGWYYASSGPETNLSCPRPGSGRIIAPIQGGINVVLAPAYPQSRARIQLVLDCKPSARKP